MAPLAEKDLLNTEQFRKDVEEYQVRKDDENKEEGQVAHRQHDRRLQ